MKKALLLFGLMLTVMLAKSETKRDTLYTELKTDIVVLSTTKETNSLKTLPASVSVFSPKNLDGIQAHSIKDLSSFAPNYFIPDYGSKATAPFYIRGIGARSGSQTVSYYVDNIPYFNTSSFDTELFDIQRIEILRGTQSTLYGRNSMGGIINVYTYSPLTYQGTNIELGSGNYNQLSVKASHYHKISNRFGFSLSGYYNRNDGYFTNQFNGKKVDNMQNAGGRIKLEWIIANNLTASYSANFDYVNQGAFPYGDLNNNGIINYNSPSYYKRRLWTNGLSLRYKGKAYEINSTTSDQYLNDDMNMDQDYTPKSLFTINQKQIENSLSEELSIKSVSKSNYQWSNGMYGFYDHLNTTPPVYMLKDGIKELIEDKANEHMPPPMKLDITDNQLDLNGKYRTPIYGLALFHQSTYNNILTQGLSATVGLRLDYEKTSLDYNANTTAHFTLMPHMPIQTIDVLLKGYSSHSYLEFLPKAVIKYQLNPNTYFYATTAKGYKSGGHNIQIFADLLQEALNAKMQRKPVEQPSAINKRISYAPEHSWNYEIGGQVSLFNNSLLANASLFYMNVTNVQITQFVKSGGGRMVSNAGKAVSKGFEVSLKGKPCTGFYLYANYGFSDARFKNYHTEQVIGGKEVDINYKNKHLPFAPSSTFSVGGNITCQTAKKTKLLDNFSLDINYAGAGRIYWTESNDLSQAFYGTLNANLALNKKKFTIELWAKNILNKNYNTFVFESMGNHFGQKGRPFLCGATIKIKI